MRTDIIVREIPIPRCIFLLLRIVIRARGNRSLVIRKQLIRLPVYESIFMYGSAKEIMGIQIYGAKLHNCMHIWKAFSVV